MMGPREIREIERLRGFKAPRARNLSLDAILAKEGAELRRSRKGMPGIAEAWATVIPPDLAARTTLVGLKRGVLSVRAADSAVRYELDRLLRSGGEARLCRLTSVALRRVKLE